MLIVALSGSAAAATRVRIGIDGGRVGASWTRYGHSRETLTVGSDRRFDGWARGYSFSADQGDVDGDLVLTVNNGYTTQWVLEDAYEGEPSVVVDPREDGDLYVTVTSDEGTREFLIADGGLGPVYAGGSVPIERVHHNTFVFDLGIGHAHHYRYHPVYVAPPRAGINHVWRGHEFARDRVEIVHGHNFNGHAHGDHGNHGSQGDHGNHGNHESHGHHDNH